MKKQKEERSPLSSVMIPTTLKNEFRKICIVQDQKPAEVLREMLSKFIEKEKKKQNIALVVNA